jgi:hypothetical protein
MWKKGMQIIIETSISQLYFNPCHACEAVQIHIINSFFELASNQLFVCSNFEHFYSSTSKLKEIIILLSRLYKSFFAVVKVYLKDPPFKFVNNALYPGDLLCWVKPVSISLKKCSNLANLTII